MAAAYAVSARIDRGRPHRVAAASGATVDDGRPAARGRAAADDPFVDTSPPGQQEIELRWLAFRERWSQLWFFLLDPESWR
jgi:hypothetical protein